MEKLTNEELQKLTEIRKEATKLITSLGEVQFQKILVDSELEKLKVAVIQNSKSQKELLDSLTEKYGNGSLDIETGEINPIAPAQKQ